MDRLGLHGEGLAGALRVPFALPAERVRGAAEDRVLAVREVVAASPHRVRPPCRHFGTCGGCALQHASPGYLAAWKVEVVQRALAARGLEAPMRPAAVSPPLSRRRAVLAGRRTRKGAVVGFRGRRSGTIVGLAECHVVRPEILAALPALSELVGTAGSRGRAVRMTVTAGPAGLDLDVGGAKPLDAELRRRAAAFAERHDLARLAWQGEVLVVRRPPFQLMGRARVVPPPGAFLQATEEGERALVAAVREAVGGARRVVDLFAGCGTFALPLAERAEVHAVEAGAATLAALDAAWRGADGLRRVSTEARDLFRRPVSAAEMRGVEAAVIDPPRAGAAAQCAELARSDVRVVAVVSCNPVSFARDAAALVAGGYRLDWVQVVDQFRWSAHVELAARFAR